MKCNPWKLNMEKCRVIPQKVVKSRLTMHFCAGNMRYQIDGQGVYKSWVDIAFDVNESCGRMESTLLV